jgi:hypothetical protein
MGSLVQSEEGGLVVAERFVEGLGRAEREEGRRGESGKWEREMWRREITNREDRPCKSRM